MSIIQKYLIDNKTESTAHRHIWGQNVSEQLQWLINGKNVSMLLLTGLVTTAASIRCQFIRYTYLKLRQSNSTNCAVNPPAWRWLWYRCEGWSLCCTVLNKELFSIFSFFFFCPPRLTNKNSSSLHNHHTVDPTPLNIIAFMKEDLMQDRWIRPSCS